MTSLPSLTGKDPIAVLRKAGFEVLRVKGSHHFLTFPSTRLVRQATKLWPNTDALN